MRSCADAIAGLDADATVLVVATPHGDDRGVYAGRKGDLDGFGHRGVAVETQSQDDVAGEITRTWRAPTLGVPFDHGVVVPLALGLMPDRFVVAVSVPDEGSGRELGRVVAQVAERRPTRIFFAASAHLGAALTERAPIPLEEQALALEDEVLGDLPHDAGVLADRARDLATTGKSCSAGPLAAFGELFRGRGARVVAYERPYGVGYLVAHIDA